MTTPSWIPSAKLEAELRQRAGALAGAPGEAVEQAARGRDLLELLGRARLGAATAFVDELVASHGAALADVVVPALAALDLPALEDAGLTLAERLAELDDAGWDDPPTEAELDELERTLETRDRVAFVLEGARLLAGRPPQLAPYDEAALLAFDGALRERSHGLLCLGARRSEHLARVAPEHRAELWWWSTGLDLPPDALESFALVARTLHRFPETRALLDRLVRAEGALEDALSGQRAARAPGATPGRGARVVSLAEYLRGRARRLVAPHTPAMAESAVAVACADEEVTVLELPELSLSTTDTHLIVDYAEQEPLPDGDVPTLWAEEVPPLASQPTYAGRFELPMSAPHFARPSARLRVPTARGWLEVPLPFDDDR